MKTVTGRSVQKNPSMHLMLNLQDLRKYNASTLEEYQSRLASMNLSDLQSHAIKIGVKATADRERIVKILASQFIKDKNKYDLAVYKEQNQFAEKEEVKQTALEFPIF
jgi:hypothetical protein